MFIGHYAVGFAGKRVAPRASLGWLFAACQWPDLLWPILSLVGMEHFHIAKGDTAFTPLAFDYYPWSHSLLMDLIWSAALGLFYLSRKGDRRGAAIIGALVFSHWIFDWITHRPDMPLSPSNDHRFGLGMWNNVPLTIAAEIVLLVAGVWLYHRATKSVDRIGRYGALALAAALLAIYVANILSPPPPNTSAVSVSALALWILVPIANWIDHHRITTAVDSAGGQDPLRG